ncbi:hypothetical protein BD309DRAFT_1009618 [Dichomitus squalens]|uniref:Uncharacterized protein n=1 Tax=Dichomitus squalens TaxID=114155 RepID=A0A4Q9NQ44_9APHY|nr:hypothetical protein BD309DRAFT_1009618 [Dichomitus squalens]TBU54841.1 hypothetical protein BD310DRAFT_969572 [Dichomitus squalens]
MRVLDTETGQFVEIDHLTTEYAILSHTWDHQNGEQTYAQLKKIQERYILRPGARPQNNAPHRQDNPTSAATPPYSPSSPTPATSCAPFPAAREAASTTTLPNERTALLAGGVGPTEGRLEDTYAVNACPHDTTQSRLSGPWRRLLQFLHLIIRSAARFVKLLGHSPPADSISTVPEPVLAHVVIHDTAAPPVEESSARPPASSPSNRVPNAPACIWDDPELSPKIKLACAVARQAEHRYIWIDSCCIDRASSSELSEAINSMYMWYGDSTICYAYLADVPPGESSQSEGSFFRKSRWFTRGWTLQELIAPGRLVFLSADWEIIGSKGDFIDVLEQMTGIDRVALLLDTGLDEFSVAQRFSWASKRETERVEDQAYSLMGIFDINMPTLYGEGDRALRRLQEEILRRTPDQSLFAWGGAWKPPLDVDEQLNDVASVPRDKAYRLMAYSPSSESSITASLKEFLVAHTTRAIPHDEVGHRLQLPSLSPTEYTFTPYGIRTQLPVLPLFAVLHPDATDVPHDHPMSHWYLAILGCEHGDHPGHLLGRVCRILPSKSGVDLLYAGWIRLVREGELPGPFVGPDMLVLSPVTLERCHPRIELRTVYISHPARRARRSEDGPYIFEHHSDIALKLSLVTRDALRAQKYTISLQGPDQAHPTMYRLTLSHDDHTITIEYDYTLEFGGVQMMMRARVEVWGSLRPSTDVLSTPSPREVTWHDLTPWWTSHKDQQVTSRQGSGLSSTSSQNSGPENESSPGMVEDPSDDWYRHTYDSEEWLHRTLGVFVHMNTLDYIDKQSAKHGPICTYHSSREQNEDKRMTAHISEAYSYPNATSVI